MAEEKLTEYQKMLVTTHLKLAQRLALEAWRRSPETMEKNEVVGIAYQGLLNAAIRFDPAWRPENDPKYDPFLAFGAYARTRISGAIKDWQRSIDHVPKRQRATYKTLQQHGHGTGRSAEELADLTGLDVNKIRFITHAVETTAMSLDTPPDGWNESGYAPGGHSAPGSVSVEDSALASTIQGVNVATFRQMSPLQKSILALRYYRGLDLTEISVELQVGLSVVRATHKDAIEIIHAAMRQAAS